MKPHLIKILSAVIIAVGAVSVSAKASVVAFQWDEGSPGSLSPFISHHNAVGPVLADDFVPVVGGAVHSVSWWGGATSNGLWEITFHSDTVDPGDGLHEPAIGPDDGGLSQHFANATGVDPDGDGVFKYTTLWTPQDLTITAGLTYWFSAANASTGWQWALTDGATPDVGTQAHTPVESRGGVPSLISGPHDGPWNPLLNSPVNLAFQVNVVPVPAAIWLFGTALIGFIGFSRRRKIA